jgi:hypothetical protein
MLSKLERDAKRRALHMVCRVSEGVPVSFRKGGLAFSLSIPEKKKNCHFHQHRGLRVRRIDVNDRYAGYGWSPFFRETWRQSKVDWDALFTEGR